MHSIADGGYNDRIRLTDRNPRREHVAEGTSESLRRRGAHHGSEQRHLQQEPVKGITTAGGAHPRAEEDGSGKDPQKDEEVMRLDVDGNVKEKDQYARFFDSQLCVKCGERGKDEQNDAEGNNYRHRRDDDRIDHGAADLASRRSFAFDVL